MADGPARFPPDCTCPAVLRYQLGSLGLQLPGCHRLWPTVPSRSSRPRDATSLALQPPEYRYFEFGHHPRSLAATRRITTCFLFHRVLRCFTSPGSLPPAYEFSQRIPDTLASGGLPHSEIRGSRPVSGSPRLIAAVHVLHRLSSPRHPPRALRSLTISLRRVHGF